MACSRRLRGILLVSIASVIGCISGCDRAPSPLTYVTESSVERELKTLPLRIVSLDFCADQYVLKLADRQRILALSPDSEKPFSYLREQASGIDKVRPVAESILRLQPDLVVRSYGGGPNINRFLSDAGISVLNVGWAGDVEGIKRVTREMARGMGVAARGETVVAEMEARLAQLPVHDKPEVALYMTPSGTTSGAGSLVHDLLLTAGASNFQTQPGWRSLPLEKLAYQQPDMVAAAFFDTNGRNPNTWSAMRHPLARAQISELPTVFLDGAWMSCGAWFAIDAVEAIAQRRYAASER